ncbi:MAG: hypothetical protein QG671_1513 [Actinomycetota bacterium]|nr:hypothetical protein [Actinomycetota bacterium]
MWRWLTDPEIRASSAGDAVYSAFGTTRRDVDPEANAMLKALMVLHLRHPRDVLELVRAYRATFPGDAAAVDRVVSDTLVGQALPDAPELWMTNRGFTVGATVLDQYRAVPLPRSFDLNAASVVDLLAVPGMDRRTAGAVVAGAPYRSVEDLARVPGVASHLVARFRSMATEHATRSKAPENEQEFTFNLTNLVVGYVIRALGFLLAVVVCGAVLHRRIRRIGWGRALATGTALGLLGLLPAWIRPVLGASSPVAEVAVLLLPVVLVGVPGLLLDVFRHHDGCRAHRTALAWAVSPLLVVLVIQTW